MDRNRQDGGLLLAATSPVFLDRFFVMAFEVTNAELFAWVRDAGAPAPPTLCGCTYRSPDPLDLTEYAEESGWTDAGQPAPGNEQRPVACVTREEAAAYCAARGGRLPTLPEYMRLVRGAWPSLRQYPWGESPPVFGSAQVPPDMDEYVELGRTRPDEVGTRPRGANEWGVFALAGGVSEFASECSEQLRVDAYADAGPVIRPPRASSVTRCADSPVVVGDPFRSLPREVGQLGNVSAYTMPPGEYLRFALGYPELDQPAVDAQAAFGSPRCDAGHPSDVRSNLVGFRCVWDTLP